MIPRREFLKQKARELRKEMTDAERLLWSRLRLKQIKGLQFYRQKVIGNYIVDFYCHAANMIIEIDGGQHYSIEGMKKDKIRDEYLMSRKLRVLRFSDREVLKNIDDVMEEINKYL
jgi:very-short-patch-repair endonuclease